MIFLDSCIWIELCASRMPDNAISEEKMRKASNLLNDIIARGENIVTSKEQLIEIFSAIIKAKSKEYNALQKSKGQVGIGKIKDYRNTSHYDTAISLCKMVYNDICQLAKIECIFDTYSIENILDNIKILDINDFMYLQYCLKTNTEFYTFDSDFRRFVDDDQGIHVL